MSWFNIGAIGPRTYRCGYCDNTVGPKEGYYRNEDSAGSRIYVCSFCDKPTYFQEADRTSVKQFPGVAFGEAVRSLPPDVETLYNEARACTTVGAYTGAVLVCRKILMNAAVSLGAPTGKNFADYVTWLVAEGHVPKKGHGWVDHIRQRGNVANHEIPALSKDESEEMVIFTGMLLKMIHEFPARLPAGQNPPAP